MILEIDCGNSYLKWRVVDKQFTVVSEGGLKSSKIGYKYFADMALFAKINYVMISAVIKSNQISGLCLEFVQAFGAGLRSFRKPRVLQP